MTSEATIPPHGPLADAARWGEDGQERTSLSADTMDIVLAEEDRQALTRLEEAMWREDTRFDVSFMETALAPDFFEFGRSGRTHTRGQTLAASRHFIDSKLPLPDLKIRLLDRGTAHVTYNSEVRYDGITEHSRRSSIWSRTDSGWVLRFHQGTPYLP